MDERIGTQEEVSLGWEVGGVEVRAAPSCLHRMGRAQTRKESRRHYKKGIQGDM